jgi:hypothetical protein
MIAQTGRNRNLYYNLRMKRTAAVAAIAALAALASMRAQDDAACREPALAEEPKR